ncbi:hypothetical protein QZH41_005588 [Actinostola sp. cb2023]|nr:hypothetical protein QZH41_005588 [Actinostola sp. cb2023]
MESGEIKDSQITASSYFDDATAPSYARLHMKPVRGGHDGGWVAKTRIDPQWVQIDLGTVKKVTAIATQGLPDEEVRTETYQILSGNDPNSLTLYGNGKIFTGNTDSNTVVKNILNPPIEAKYIRVLMKSWHYWPSIRIELYGCIEENVVASKATSVVLGCNGPLGMENGEIKDSQIRGFSNLNEQSVDSNARLNGKSAWVPETRRASVIEVDLRSVKEVTAIATQGHPDKDQWVKSYEIKYINSDGRVVDYGGGPLTGNTDRNSVVKNALNPPIKTSRIFVVIKSWDVLMPALRMELYGCSVEKKIKNLIHARG